MLPLDGQTSIVEEVVQVPRQAFGAVDTGANWADAATDRKPAIVNKANCFMLELLWFIQMSKSEIVLISQEEYWQQHKCLLKT